MLQFTAFDGYKLDDMGNPISLNAEALVPNHPCKSRHGRFREAAVPTIKADPHIAKLVQEKTEIAIKLLRLNQHEAPKRKGISAQELEQLNAFREKVGELQHSPEGAKLLGKIQTIIAESTRKMDSFLNLCSACAEA